MYKIAPLPNGQRGDFILAKESLDLYLRVLNAIGTVDNVGARLKGKVRADSAWRR